MKNGRKIRFLDKTKKAIVMSPRWEWARKKQKGMSIKRNKKSWTKNRGKEGAFTMIKNSAGECEFESGPRI